MFRSKLICRSETYRIYCRWNLFSETAKLDYSEFRKSVDVKWLLRNDIRNGDGQKVQQIIDRRLRAIIGPLYFLIGENE